MDIPTMEMIKSRLEEIHGDLVRLRDWGSLVEEYGADSAGDISVRRDGAHVVFLWHSDTGYYGGYVKVREPVVNCSADYKYCFIAQTDRGYQMIVPYEIIDLPSLMQSAEEITPPESSLFADLFIQN